MKKILFILVSIIFITNINAQFSTAPRICIDPGHGGHEAANDRYIPETGFWESDANWAKANYLKPMLTDLGASVKITRNGNSDSDDLGLSTRSQIANDFNADYFHSIHSNGYNGTSNYTLMLFRGYDNDPVYDNSKVMGAILADQIYATNRTTAKYNRGDWDFYNWGYQVGLGVLSGLQMAGTLSEGSFHDYIPESWRLMNGNYRKHEALAIARSFVQFFNATPVVYGSIAGIVRDPSETVTYYHFAGSDAYKPVNNLVITLQPGNRVCYGDDKNNGFFLFDSLAPGTYKVYYQAEYYKTDSSTIVVTANKTTFADKSLTLLHNPNAPQVVSCTPLNGAQNVGLRTPIVFNFDIKMDRTSTQSALTIQPYVNGSYSWANNDKQLTFTPSLNYQTGAEITVTLKNTAKTIFDVPLTNNYVTKFKTRSKLNIVDVYPKHGNNDVSTTVNVRILFDAPINSNTMAGNISFTNSAGTSVNVYVDNTAYALGQITFDPKNPLIPGESYNINLKKNLADTEGLKLGVDTTITFTVDSEVYQSGTVLDEFEAIGGWWDPNNSGSTVGTDPTTTTFTIVTNRKVNGTNSGKLSYTFTENSGGVCRAHNSTKPNIGSSTTSKVGMWVYGDLSYNTLEYWFYYSSSSNAIVKVDTLNWTGWKLKYINTSDITGTGDKLFHSIVVKQQENGAKTGAIYVDDLQKDIVTGVESEEEELSAIPNSYSLDQNFPNPFNPSTQIRFSLPETANVSLTIFNVLGEKIMTLVNNESLNSGTHTFTWNGRNEYGQVVPSGVYFYRVNSPKFTETKKMMMLK